MHVEYTIRIGNMPRNDRAMAQILTREGMDLDEDCRANVGSFTWRDNVRGAGTRTFIWEAPDTELRWQYLQSRMPPREVTIHSTCTRQLRLED